MHNQYMLMQLVLAEMCFEKGLLELEQVEENLQME